MLFFHSDYSKDTKPIHVLNIGVQIVKKCNLQIHHLLEKWNFLWQQNERNVVSYHIFTLFLFVFHIFTEAREINSKMIKKATGSAINLLRIIDKAMASVLWVTLTTPNELDVCIISPVQRQL